MQLFFQGKAEIIAAPQLFDFSEELAQATTIRMATAFAHKTGWKMLKPSIDRSNANLLLLAGASFFQTEPEVLRAWLRQDSTDARLYVEKGLTFHPKTLIVDGPRPFAIVGSGNLSRGGLETNVECGVYLNAPAQLNELRAWFDRVFDEAKSLSTVIDDYEHKWKTLRNATRDLVKKQRELETAFADAAEATMERWDAAVRSAQKFRKTPHFESRYKSRKDAGSKIKKILCFPEFDFDLKAWREFYAIQELGHLIPIRRDGIFKKRAELQSGLRQLISNPGSETCLNEVLSKAGKYRIVGLGLNTISKLLAVHAPAKFAVYNRPVDETLRSFGYAPPRGATLAGKYLAYNRMMDKFKKATELTDAYALDAFFYHYAKDLEDTAKRKFI